MKRPLAIFTASLFFGHSLISAASAECASRSDRDALRTAAMQQELMVAALKCHDVNEYNRFVLSHQPELIRSDQALEAYFQRAGQARGTATYNKYKTELANAASLRSSQDPDGFCSDAGRTFEFALRPMSLSEIVASVDLESDRAIENCPILADNSPRMAIPTSPAPTPRAARDLPYPNPTNAAPARGYDEDNDDSAQSLDSQSRSDAPPADWGYDDDPDD